jgi:hypothetical protein
LKTVVAFVIAIEAPLTTGHELLDGFKTLVSTQQEDLDLVEKEQPHTATIDF